MGLGISVYPEHAGFEENAAYIEAAGKRGFTRVFSCLLSAEGDRAAIAGEYTRLHDLAHAQGMEVVLDVSPAVFAKLGIGSEDLSFFAGLHTDGIRLDEPFTGAAIARLTRNPWGLKVELNASSADGALASTLACDPDRAHLMACHNFYPQRYTGLSWGHFERESRAYRAAGVRLAAFVSCTDHAAFGPWPQREGLPTLEEHRDLPMDLQARHLMASGLVDDVIVSNCFPTAAELDALAALDPSRIQFRAVPEGGPSPVEREIAFAHRHVLRGDRSAYLARSADSRTVFAGRRIPARNVRDLRRGDIVVVNDASPRYRGELQLALRDIPADGTRNVVATLPAPELALIDLLAPWSAFGFLEA